MNNRQLAHEWYYNESVSKTQRASNFYYEGMTIYSYGGHFPIARKADRIVFFTYRGYSNSTSKHIGYTRQAIPPHVQIIYCNTPSQSNFVCLDDAVAYAVAQFDLYKACKRKDTYKAQGYLDSARARIQSLYNALSPIHNILWETQIETSKRYLRARIRKEFKNIMSEPTIRIEPKLPKNIFELIQEWRAGKRNSLPPTPKTFIRVTPECFETSKGMRIPHLDGLRLYTAIRHNTVKLGDMVFDRFKVLELSDSHIAIGCHNIDFDEFDLAYKTYIESEGK